MYQPFDKVGALDQEAEKFELKEEVVEKSPDGTSKVWLTWTKVAGRALAVAGAVAAALTPKKSSEAQVPKEQAGSEADSKTGGDREESSLNDVLPAVPELPTFA